MLVTKPYSRPERFFLSKKYADTYMIFSMSSNEEAILAPEIARSIREGATSAETLIDIGSADGRITAGYIGGFQRSYLFEPNPVLFSVLRSRLGAAPNYVNDVFSRDSAGVEKVDVVVATHVLYHVDAANDAFFRDVADVLKPGGAFVVTLWNEDSQAWKLCSNNSPGRWLWTAETLMSQQTLEALARYGLRFLRATKLNPIVHGYTREAQESILSFLLGNSDESVFQIRNGSVHVNNTAFNLVHGLGNSQTVMTFVRVEN